MKVLIVLAALVAASCALLSDAAIKRQWEEFKGTHTKTYASPIEEAHRMKIFKENIDRISKHNARFDKGEVTFKVGVNKFADMYTHEVAEKLNGFRMESFGLVKKGNQVHKKFNLRWPWSKNVDWRSKGYVTPVKDQGKCSAGWAFSATGALEGQLFKKYGQLVPLSAQNLVDCSYGDNNGCNGRRIDEAFAYVRYNLGIDTEKGYPYTGKLGTCSYTLVHKGGTATGYVDVNPTEDDLKDAVATVGPVSAVIDASNWSFQMYASGIYYEPQCSSNNVTHGVLVVGFGSGWLNNDYWIVKNSMGTSWGEEGYIRMARNKNNNCGIATQAGYPTV